MKKQDKPRFITMPFQPAAGQEYNGTVYDMYFSSMSNEILGVPGLVDGLDSMTREPAIAPGGTGYVAAWLQKDPADESVMDVIGVTVP